MPSHALDYPHFGVNNIGCDSCHFIYGTEPSLLPPWTAHTPLNIDDTQYNTLCWSCHNDVDAPYVRTHSSLQIDDSYGDWTVECRVCHNPHYQKQKEYGSASYLYSGTSTTVTALSITKTGAGWETDAYDGMVVIPNISQNKYVYKITGNTDDTLTVQGPMDLTKITTGNTFAILYGNLINKAIDLSKITIDPLKSGSKTTRFFRPTGSKSFADGDATYDGVCEVCHTQTTHFRNNGSGSNQLHTNVGSPAGTNCTTCHSHTYGFRHGGGEGTGCEDCHGHDAGYGGVTGGKGTYVAHSTHTENDTDDKRGPNVGCGTCHNTSSFPNFADGVSYSDYKAGTEMTTVCNPCHSPGGTYNGVSDASLGAKNNWSISTSSDSRVYEADGSLKAGKEKWCATCHDESPSQIQSVNAPNVVGDEDGSFTYGTGWGFYKTGHGLSSGQKYPESGGVVSGAGKGCLDCHVSTTAHIDGLARTFNDDNSGTNQSSEYRIGYRLKQIDGQEPMLIPKNNDGNSASDYRLCMQGGCHPDNGTGPFLDGSNLNTNMRNGGTNLHNYHLDFNNAEYSPDFDGGYVSEPSCVTCHNVHGSKRLVMLRDGSLSGMADGFEIWYYNPDIVSSGNPPSPDNLPLSASTGTVYQRNSPRDFCAASCHSVNIATTARNPFQNVSQAPTLDWTGETNYAADGVNPDSGASGGNFVFRVKYTDTNNDAPTYIQVWIDRNDDGDYLDADEQLNMTAANPVDTNYTDGKFYTNTVTLYSAGDNTFNYRFYAYSGTSEATGGPTSDHTVSIANSAPTLNWTGETYYAGDGINPNTGGDGSSFEFRVTYVDADNTAPASIQVWVDADDSGTYEPGEKYDMTGVDGSDTAYSDGKLYTKTLTIAYAGDGILNYRFYASDGTADATGSPASNSTLTVLSSANNPPYLDWVAETCRTNGVKPALGLATGNSEFKIKYTDPDNQCPPAASDIQVWIDINDSGTYESGEKYNLSEEDAGDTTCSDGKIYKVTKQLGYAGDGVLNYRFYASDGTDSATGDPATTDNTLTVVSTANAKGVRTGSGDADPWYNSIQGAIDAVNGAHTVLVYEGTYNVGTYLYFNGADDNNTNVKSVCGADSTILYGTGTVVYFLSNSGSTLDGFQVTGGNYGIYLNSSSPTITNSKIHGISGSGIDTGNSGSILTLSNSEVYSNTGRGIYIRGNSGNTITNSIIRDNPGGAGAGVYTIGSVTFTDTTIKNNTATGDGGGVFSNSAPLEFYRCTITGNVASGRSGAIELGNIGATAYLENSIVADNQGSYGGASFVNGGSFTAINSTFANNRATGTNGGAISNNSGTVTIRNSILWNNVANTVGHIAYLNGGSMVISDSIMNNDGDGNFVDVPYFYAGSPTVSGYISENDPFFVNESGGDYHIQPFSDAVDNASATYAPATDIDGDSRPQGSADDIGADEYNGTINNAPTLSWTGETNYVSDGVNPDSGVGGSSFEFRTNYTDADNNAPTSIQVWVDMDDSGTYESSEKYDMTSVNVDSTYSDGKLYTKTLSIGYAGNGTLNYRFYASDGKVDATGAPTAESTITITNNVPALAWTGETNYTADAVNPDIGVTGGSYEFRIDYTDVDDTAPNYIEVWVDEDDSGVYDLDEKYSMTETDGGDTDYTDGKRYTKTLTLSSAGDGVLNYTFRASDGTDSATGSPTSDKTVTVTGAPALDWTGEANYTGDGVNPDSAVSGSSFEFRIKYTDAGNIAPSSIQVWIDRNDDGDYLDANEKEDMTEVDPLDITYTDGKLYTKTLTISGAGDGVLNYRFYASNGTYDAVGTPTSNSTVIINNPPTLAWTGEANYESDGVNPDIAASGSNFEFRVKYTDADNHAPSSIQVWVDTDDSGTYSGGEKYTMTEVDPLDTTYTDGKLYTKTLAISAAGDGVLNYRFYARDIADDATGAPASNKTVTVTVSTILQVPSQYATIQAAINAAVSGNIIQVSNGTYSENISFIGKAVTVQSVNGASVTTIQGSGSNAPVVTFSNGESSAAVLDGFTIDNQSSNSLTRGVYISGATPVIKNSIIQGNTADNSGDLLGGGGVLINNSAPTFDNVTIRANAALNRNGCGIYITGAAGGATVTGSTIGGTVTGDGNKCTNGTGGGIYFTGSTTGTLTISNSNIQYNQGNANGGGLYLNTITNLTVITNSTILNNYTEVGCNGYGGGIHANAAPLSITGSTISNNSSGTCRGGGGLYLNSASATITGSTFNSNTSGGLGGAGILIEGTAPSLILFKSNIRGNNALNGGDGGGIRIASGSATITNSILAGNRVSDDWNYGGGIQNGGTLNLYFSTVADNYAHYGGGLDCAGTENIYNSIIYGNEVTGGNAEIRGTTDTLYLTETNPGVNFVLESGATSSTSTTNGNYHLQSTSNCIDTGDATNAPADDIEGNTRPQDIAGKGDGTDDYDKGAYEYFIAPVQISGTVYTDEGTTTISDGATVRLIVNGSSAGTGTTSSGAYSINATPSAGDAMIVYIDGHASNGTTVTVSNGSALSGLNIYADRLITRHDNSGSLTNANMNTAKGSYVDDEILYSISGSDMTATAAELFVPGGQTFAPGGAVTAVDVDINGTFNPAANAVNVSGNWDATGGVFSSTGTVTFNASSGTKNIAPGGTDANHDFQNIVFNDAGGTATYQLVGAIDIDSTLTLADGILDTSGSNYAVTVSGNFTQNGGRVTGNASTFTVGGNFSADGTEDSTGFNNATLVLTGTGSTISYNNLASWWANGFNNLTAGQNGETDTLNNWLTVKNNLTIGTGTLAGSSTLALTGTGDVLAFDPASNISINTLMFLNYGGGQNIPTLNNGYSCDISIAGGSGLTVSQTGNVTINSGKNLSITGDGFVDRALTYNTAGYALNVGGNLVIGAGGDTALKTLNGTNSTITVGGNLSLTPVGGGTTPATFTSTGSTVILSGTNKSINGSITFNNLTKTVTSADTLTFEAGKTTTINGTVTLNGASGQLLALTSSTGSSAWNFVVNSGATKSISYVSVSWSDASGSDVTQKPIAPTSSTDGGNNTDWFAAANSTTAGTATATEASSTSINISMPYTNDDNGNNTYTVKYKLSSSGTWLDWGTNPKAHTASPYTDTITGLTAGESYNVQMTYNDIDGVSGTNPQQVDLTLSGGALTVCASGCDYTTIQNAINAASGGETVQVNDSGTYGESITFKHSSTGEVRNITVKAKTGETPSIVGDGTNKAVVTFDNGQTSSAVLDGFTINNQAANTATRGVYISGATPTIKNSIIEGNSANNGTNGGGGVYVDNSIPTFDNCTIRSNTATNRNGGGIYITGAAGGATITNSTIGGSGTANSANLGGGIYFTGSTSGTLSISGSTIAYNTTTQPGAGVYITGITNTTTFTNTSINNNTSSQTAGGIYSNGSPLSFTNSNINNNATGSTASYDGGGIYLTGAAASASISGGTINGNSGRYGGGIYITGSTAATPLSISNVTMSSNTGYLGGAAYLTGVTNTVTFAGTTISGNTGIASAGGIYNNAVTLDITNSHIDSNTVTNSSQRGGGLYLTGAKTTTITDTTVDSNTATGLGGGIYAGGGATLSFTGGSINSNATSSTGDGGGISVDGATTLSVSKTNIRGNKARYGGGIYYVSTSATAASITNCTITGNTHTGTLDGGGIYTSGTAMDIINSTLAGNYAYRYGGGIRVQAGTVNIKNSILYGNTAGTSGPQISGSPTVSYSDIEGTFAGTGNIDSDPLFSSFVAGDKAGNNDPKTSGNFHIQSGSPCKNTGNNADAPAGTDIDGDTRILDGTVDMGSDEYVP